MLLLGIMLAACSGSPSQIGNVDQYVQNLPSWNSFSPPKQDDDSATGTPTTKEETAEVENPDTGLPEEVTYTCTTTPRSLTKTPEEIVMFEPNASIMWVGNLIQGKSYADGLGTLRELSIRQRAPLKISIDLLTGNNFAIVDNPSLTTVQAAIGDLIDRAEQAGFRSGSSIDYTQVTSRSTQQAALELGLSGHYLGFSAEAKLNVSRNAAQITLMAHFVQKMFTVSIELPQTPGEFFSSDFTSEKLQQQISAGSIGPDNLPVYLASITYGRILTYKLTSTFSEERMKAAIAASFNGLVGGGGGYSETELRQTLAQNNIRVTAIGGEGQSVLDLISSGNLKDYFREDSPLTAAKPLSYQLNNLGDNSIAKVGETTSYDLKECTAKTANPGTFEFLPAVEKNMPIDAPYSTLVGDFNGDDREDLLFNHKGTDNEFVVALGRSDGGFTFKTADTHPNSPVEGWSNYDTLVADVNGDDNEDLIWNHRGSGNQTFIALSNGDGTFTFKTQQTHPAGGWSGYRVLSGDINGDGRDDLIWNALSSSLNRTYVGLSNGDGSLQFLSALDRPANGWNLYTAFVGNVNGDAYADLIFNYPGSTNRTYTALGSAAGGLAFQPFYDAAGIPCCGYQTLVGDVDGDTKTDLLWSGIPTNHNRSYVGFSQGNGKLTISPFQDHPDPAREKVWALFDTLIADVNGDGRDDLIWNDTSGTINRSYVGIANAPGSHFPFDLSRVHQDHPEVMDWGSYTKLTGDINGDNRDDLIWIFEGSTAKIHVALARQ